MRRYTNTEEENIRAERLIREWARSGILSEVQAGALNADVQVDLRRTNKFLRIILFVFGILIIGASVGLTGVTLDLNDDESIAALMIIAGMISLAIAEGLVRRFRLYRFGVEEACAAGGVALTAIGIALFASGYDSQINAALFVGLLTGATGAFIVYRRLGYVYAAAAAILAVCASCFQLEQPLVVERVLVVFVLLPIFFMVRSKRQRNGEDFPGDEYGLLQAFTFATLYVAVHLHLFGSPGADDFPMWFYWLTYVAIWALPAGSVYLGILHKDRPLLDVGIAAGLVTLITNKPYLGATREVWDPVLFGLFLISVAVGLRRWLACGPEGHRNGFTPNRLLHSDKRALFIGGTASAVIQPDVASLPSDHDGFKPGGGRSGGAGASGSM